MKVNFNRQFLIILVLVNLILVSGVIFLKLEIDRNAVRFFAGDSVNTLPILAKAKVNAASKAFIVYDTEARVILAGKNENLRFAPASTSKILTALIAIETYPLQKILKAEGVSSVEGSKMKLVDGEEISVLNLLYGLMLPSGNDAAHVLAQNFPGGTEEFIKKMNETAVELKMQNTKFYDPAGYDDRNYSTATDLARLASFAIKNETFAKIVSTKFITVKDTSGINIHELTNLNEMLGIDGVNGIKTGYTDEAGGVLVTSIKHEGRTYIIVVLNSPDRFRDTREVINEAISKIKLLFY